MRSHFTMNKLITLIESHKDFVILRHINPDGDAFGSQWGLANFIMENYPDKKVYVLGERPDKAVFFPENIELDGYPLDAALTIVLDSATMARIDGPYENTNFLFNIDHHPTDAPYGDDYISEPYRSSTCELLANLLLPTGKVSKTTASYLLAGILTDTNKFTTENTSEATLSIASKLMGCGADITALSRHFFSGSYNKLKISGSLIEDIEFKEGLATLIITKEKREQLGISIHEAKHYNSLMANINEFEIYIILVEDDAGMYSASLRSKDITINSICEHFGGGGHRLACGIRDIAQNQIKDLQDILIKAIKR